jgi:hypothetical protein
MEKAGNYLPASTIVHEFSSIKVVSINDGSNRKTS